MDVTPKSGARGNNLFMLLTHNSVAASRVTPHAARNPASVQTQRHFTLSPCISWSVSDQHPVYVYLVPTILPDCPRPVIHRPRLRVDGVGRGRPTVVAAIQTHALYNTYVYPVGRRPCRHVDLLFSFTRHPVHRESRVIYLLRRLK